MGRKEYSLMMYTMLLDGGPLINVSIYIGPILVAIIVVVAIVVFFIKSLL